MIKWTILKLFQNVPMSVSAANHNDTNFLNFAYDANGIIAGYVSEIDGQSDFTVEDGCVVLEGGVSNKTIRIKIQMDANYYYTYCICRLGYTMDQYNRYGVEFDGGSGKWTVSYDKYNGFAYNGSTEITLNYNDYNGSPLYGKRTAKI